MRKGSGGGRGGRAGERWEVRKEREGGREEK